MTTAHIQANANSILTMDVAIPGQSYSICAITGYDDCSCRLLEMGIAEGTRIVIERSGDPVIIRIGMSKIALSRDCLKRINVTQLARS